MTGFSLKDGLEDSLVGVTLEIDARNRDNPERYIGNLVRLVKHAGYGGVDVRRGEGTEQGIYHVSVRRENA